MAMTRHERNALHKTKQRDITKRRETAHEIPKPASLDEGVTIVRSSTTGGKIEAVEYKKVNGVVYKKVLEKA
jgi:hypothetical protein